MACLHGYYTRETSAIFQQSHITDPRAAGARVADVTVSQEIEHRRER